MNIADDCKQKLENFLLFLTQVCKDDEQLNHVFDSDGRQKILDSWFMFIERVHGWIGTRQERLFKIVDGHSSEKLEDTRYLGTELIKDVISENQLGFMDVSGIVMKVVQKADNEQFAKLLLYLLYFLETYDEINSKD